MLLTVLMYAYFKKIHSCGKIATVLRESIHFLWLIGEYLPDL
jgi:hypothetical protein